MFNYAGVFIFLSIFSAQGDIAFRNPTSALTTEYDTVVLVLGWPITTFKNNELKGKGKSDTCQMPANGDWNLHGLWPVKSKGQSPAYCNDNAPFNMELIDAKTQKRMELNWPVYDTHRDNAEFWNAQWQKHGTCAFRSKATNTLEKYFKKAIDLLDRYNISSILNNEKIIPGKSYNLQKIVDAIKKYYRNEPVVTCINLENSSDKNQYLFEVMLCLDLNNNLKACPASMKHKCIMNKQAVFPTC